MFGALEFVLILCLGAGEIGNSRGQSLPTCSLRSQKILLSRSGDFLRLGLSVSFDPEPFTFRCLIR